jgi:hypothetical protein
MQHHFWVFFSCGFNRTISVPHDRPSSGLAQIECWQGQPSCTSSFPLFIFTTRWTLSQCSQIDGKAHDVVDDTCPQSSAQLSAPTVTCLESGKYIAAVSSVAQQRVAESILPASAQGSPSHVSLYISIEFENLEISFLTSPDPIP